MFATTIATPALGYTDIECNCGPLTEHSSVLYTYPECSRTETENCIIIDMDTDNFIVRRESGFNPIYPCSFCDCQSGRAGSWRTTTNGAMIQEIYKGIDTTSFKCDVVVDDVEVACQSGYYDPREPDFMIYECEECPWLEDKYGTMIHGMTEYANTSHNITACYIPKEQVETGAWFEDASGDYVITDDCYYVE